MKNLLQQKTTPYSRLVDGKILVANVISIINGKVTYFFTGSKIIHREYDKLFLSLFIAS